MHCAEREQRQPWGFRQRKLALGPSDAEAPLVPRVADVSNTKSQLSRPQQGIVSVLVGIRRRLASGAGGRAHLAGSRRAWMQAISFRNPAAGARGPKRTCNPQLSLRLPRLAAVIPASSWRHTLLRSDGEG